MKKDFIVSKIEAPQDGSHYVLVVFTDANAGKSTGEGGSGDLFLCLLFFIRFVSFIIVLYIF
jgi:hypothetical protein